MRETHQLLRRLPTGDDCPRQGQRKITRCINGAFAAKVTKIDSTALLDLQYGHPIKAAKAAMEAKSILGAVRSQVTRQQ